ncbi:MAG: hypothetical protein QOE01_39 [Actinomycetota bacterium]|nr:hypothetical protein [Actinomycetota bacterium]
MFRAQDGRNRTPRPPTKPASAVHDIGRAAWTSAAKTRVALILVRAARAPAGRCATTTARSSRWGRRSAVDSVLDVTKVVPGICGVALVVAIVDLVGALAALAVVGAVAALDGVVTPAAGEVVVT